MFVIVGDFEYYGLCFSDIPEELLHTVTWHVAEISEDGMLPEEEEIIASYHTFSDAEKARDFLLIWELQRIRRVFIRAGIPFSAAVSL